MPKNDLMTNARVAQQDEFYTRYDTVKREMLEHRDYFKGKIVYCNCDSPESNFVKFFMNYFKELELKALFSSCLDGRCLRHTGNTTEQFSVANGSYDSLELKSLLREADCVISNPPFSGARKYLKYLTDNKKLYTFLAPASLLTSNYVADLIIDGKLDIYWRNRGGDEPFAVPDHYEVRRQEALKIIDGIRHIRVAGVRWVTNMWEGVHHPLELTATYSPEKYQKYDGWDCIEVPSVKLIPKDYKGYMGVPITYMQVWDKNKFEIVGADSLDRTKHTCNKINGKFVFRRIIIRAKDR